jgi:glycosyltransferase involved in cell wall biosynthesis
MHRACVQKHLFGRRTTASAEANRGSAGRRLLVASLSPARGGMEWHAETVAAGAAAAGWHVTFAAPDVEPLRPVIDRLRAGGVTHARVPPAARRRADHIRAVTGFVAVLARTRPDVALLDLPWPRFAFGQLLSCSLLAVPTVVVFQLVPGDVEALRRQIEPRGWLFRLAKRRQTWIAVSEHARSTVSRLFAAPVGSIGRIYNGVDVARYAGEASADEVSRIRASLGIGPDEIMILTVGRLTAQKGLGDLLSAFAKASPSRPFARLLIAGDGPERDHLEGLIASLDLRDRVRLLGNVERPDDLYRSADLFVLASRYEGFPFAMLEAMAAGLPVLATRFGGADEMVEHGRDGLLVPAGDVDGLADAIGVALDDRGRMTEMARSARLKAQRFSSTGMVEQTLAVLDHAASGRRSNGPRSGSRG